MLRVLSLRVRYLIIKTLNNTIKWVESKVSHPGTNQDGGQINFNLRGLPLSFRGKDWFI